MNPKVANLIAGELGILIGLMSWLVYSRLPSAEPPTTAEMKGKMVNSVPPDAPVSELRSPRSYTVDYGTDRARPVDEKPAPTAQAYGQQIATEPYANSVPDNSFIAVDSPSYANVDQEPEVVPSDNVESPQTVVYSQPIQIVVFSNPRRFANRCQSTPRFGAPSTITQFPDRRNSNLSDTRVVSCPNVSTPSGPPAQGPRPRGAVRQTGVTGSQQKRVAFPASPGAARRSAP